MSAREFAEWMAYYQLEPWGGQYDAMERATLAAVLANAHRDAKKKGRPFRPQDFMVRHNEREPITPEAALAKVQALNKMIGGKDLRHGDDS